MSIPAINSLCRNQRKNNFSLKKSAGIHLVQCLYYQGGPCTIYIIQIKNNYEIIQ
jgi:hypothetical protein